MCTTTKKEDYRKTIGTCAEIPGRLLTNPIEEAALAVTSSVHQAPVNPNIHVEPFTSHQNTEQRSKQVCQQNISAKLTTVY